ncbi:MAG: GGDEF domain-containing protein [Planctomycetota bacterium]
MNQPSPPVPPPLIRPDAGFQELNANNPQHASAPQAADGAQQESMQRRASDHEDGPCTFEQTHQELETPKLTVQKENEDHQQCCLVQIYPADVVDGMVLLDQTELTIGRDPAVNIVLSDANVSRRHARLQRCGDAYELHDLGSTNHTHVNGEPITRHSLESGDTIKIGSFLFKFLSAGSLESQYHETVYSALTRDALTGMMNRRYLLESMHRTLATASRQQFHVTIAMFDIDHFKSINDNHGHLVGDEVLRLFGQRITETCRVGDMLARYGGEEFCLMMTATSLAEGRTAAERCRKKIAGKPFATAVGPLDVTASFGLATYDPHLPIDPIQLIQQADQQLYEAKRLGRNKVCG